MLNIDGKGELRFIEVVEKTVEREVKVRVFPQFRLGLTAYKILDIIILYWAVKSLGAFEDALIISVKSYILRADSMPNACVPDLTWRESST